MGRMTIEVSFKQSEKSLFDRLNSRGDKSNYIKEAVKFYEAYMRTREMALPIFRTEEFQEE